MTLDVAAPPLDEETALAAYRIAQEGLTNALRHSGADHVTIAVAVEAPTSFASASPTTARG